jgi:hypothetical protein
VSRLYQSRISGWSLTLLVVAALLPVIALGWTPVGRLVLGYFGTFLRPVWDWLTGLV